MVRGVGCAVFDDVPITRRLGFCALAVALLDQLGRPLPAEWPERHLDSSWVLGLQLVRDGHIQYGANHAFSYGPWGFLSAPSGINLADLVLSGVFRGAVVAMFFLALHVCLPARPWRLPVAAGSALLIANCSQPGWILMLLIAMATLGHLVRSREPHPAFIAVAAVLAALSLQIKLSEGVLSLAVLGLLLVVTRSWRLAACAGASFGGAFVVLWLAAGQSIAQIGTWLVLGSEIVSGYADAMYMTASVPLTSILVVSVVATAMAVICARSLPRSAQVASLGIVLFLTKTGLSRVDGEHVLPAIAGLLMVAVVCLVAHVPSGVQVLVVPVTVFMALVLTVDSPTLPPRQVSLDAWPVDALPSEHTKRVAEAKSDLARELDIEPHVLGELRGHPVSVDPWEISAVWAHDLEWSPLPVFQRYGAYTRRLDEANARAVLSDPDQRVLREPGAVDDDGMSLWESPRYSLALLCNFELIAEGAEWSVLGRGARRCGSERVLSAVTVEAGDVVGIPTATDAVIAIRFLPEPRTVVDRLIGVTGVQRHLLNATLDGIEHHVPEALAGGPLIVSAPGREPMVFDLESARTISFDRGGVLEIVEIPLTGPT